MDTFNKMLRDFRDMSLDARRKFVARLRRDKDSALTFFAKELASSEVAETIKPIVFGLDEKAHGSEDKHYRAVVIRWDGGEDCYSGDVKVVTRAHPKHIREALKKFSVTVMVWGRESHAEWLDRFADFGDEYLYDLRYDDADADADAEAAVC